MHIKRKEVTIGAIVKSLKDRKLHSVAAWDDPAPLIARTINLSLSALTLLFSNPLRLLRIIMVKKI